jgi:acetyltransferase-like isoleucine patch superfamily enzyme
MQRFNPEHEHELQIEEGIRRRHLASIDARRRNAARRQIAGIISSIREIERQSRAIIRASKSPEFDFGETIIEELYRVRRHVQLAACGQSASLPPISMLPRNASYGGDVMEGSVMPSHMGAHAMVYQPVIFLKPEAIKIDDGARIDSFCKIEGGDGVTIGSHVHVASFCHLNIGGGRLIIESGAAFASGAKVITGSNSYEGLSCSAAAPRDQQIVTKGETVIKRNAFICTNAVVLPGITIGEHAVLAAGGVATKNIPPYEIWGGVPARKIGEIGRDLTQAEIVDQFLRQNR